ncbi:MAG TPA: beta-ketoacyl-ACP synthase III [Thermomicrobiales bacterium]|nr:3-oxoacyl-ACP synthase [Chloroflexota bacterium]HCG29617.1 3-oxoacyl-ACP synthase [Chloroflexota bacterium]HQZ88557.1 beta-ketoacyl-ACP synthase III [Thermomicrobiales bacterium]HRA30330.1 beta-ketoacyl-ACP synthase III [Thermomicrobiales bacterium]
MPRAAITGWGMYVPERVLSNDDLSRMVDTNDEWIVSRTGIRERRIAESTDTVTSTSTASARLACEKANLDPAELDLIVVGTFTADQYMPSIACQVQNQIGARRAAAFDLNAACTSFVYALATATQFIESGLYKRVLVIGTDINSRFLDYTDRGTCVLFGDGSGAVVLEASDADEGVLSIALGADGSAGHHLTLGDAESVVALNGNRTMERPFIRMNGPEVYRFAVKVMGEVAAEAIARAGLTFDDVDLLVPHQANLRIIDAAAKRLELPRDRVWVNVHDYGNTSSASVPIGLVEAFEAGAIRDGMNVVVVAFGGGLTWAAGVVRWGSTGVARLARV